MSVRDGGREQRLRYLALAARRSGGIPFLTSSAKLLPGGGTEVTGYRDYAPGDDYRHIHWTWCARRDEILVKVFEGQADRQAYLLLDCSPSMAAGRPAKFDVARQIAATLGYLVLANLDRLGVLAFADGLVGELPSIRHETRYCRLLDFLNTLSPQGARTNLRRAVEMFVARDRRRGPVVVVSDLYDAGGFRPGFELLRYHGYEPRLVQLHDPREDEAVLLGDVELLDVESQTVRRVTITERVARRYRQRMAAFRHSVSDYCRRKRMPFLAIPCDMPVDEIDAKLLVGGRVRANRSLSLSP